MLVMIVPSLVVQAVCIAIGYMVYAGIRFSGYQISLPLPQYTAWLVGWVLATSFVGLIAGFFGPLLFLPGANQGPIVGIFFTGPLGAIAGLIGFRIFLSKHIKRTEKKGSVTVCL
jgi:hypothetical protein